MRQNWKFAGAILMIAGGITGCGGGDKSPVAPSLPETRYALTVVLGEGVSGSPATSGTYRAGERVAYSYAAASGYINPGVVLDRVLAPLSGTVVMDRNHELIVGAQRVVAVPSEDMPAVLAAEKVLQTPQLANYETYLNELAALYGRYGGNEAYQHGQAVIQRAFGTADMAALRAMQAALHGQIFEIGEVPAASPPAAPGAGLFGVDVIFINGMIVAEDEAALAALELRRAISEIGLPVPVRVRLFYNASALKKAGLPEYCLIQSLSAFLDPSALVAKFASCFGKALTSDMAEAVGQAAALLTLWDAGAAEEAKQLAEVIQAIRLNSRNVILVGHSQGTLMAQEALNVLATPDRCVLAVSLGGPLGEDTWGLTERELAGFTVGGKKVWDLILELGLNFFPSYETNITRDADRIVTEAERAASTKLVIPKLVWFQQALRLHKFLQSYLPGTESRALIQEIVRRHVETLQETEECTPSTGPASGVYGVDAGWTSYLYRVDLAAQGRDTQIGAIFNPRSSYYPFTRDLAVDSDGNLWGVGESTLYLIDPANAQVLWSWWFQGMSTPTGLTVDTRPNSPTRGIFYGLAAGATALIRMDPIVTGTWTVVGSTGVSVGVAGDLAFGADGKLYATLWTAVGNAWWIVVLDPATGRIISAKPLQEKGVEGLVFVGQDLYGFTTEGGWWLIKIDPLTGQTTRIRPLSFQANGVG